VSVIAVGSIRSCGATTLALGLAATWPTHRRMLLVEADPAGGTLAAAAGFPAEPSLVSLAAAMRRTEAVELALAHTHSLPNGAPVLAAPATSEMTRRALGMLAVLLANLTELEGDVVLDCGRLEGTPERPSERVGNGVRTPRTNTERFLAADAALLAVRPQLPDLHAIGAFLEHPDVVERRHARRLRLVLVGDGPYPDTEIAATFHTEVAAHLPFDAAAASALPTTTADDRELRRVPFIRSLRSLAEELAPTPVQSTSPPARTVTEMRHDLPGLRRFRALSHATTSNGNGIHPTEEVEP
jgi:hypothetical protein